MIHHPLDKLGELEIGIAEIDLQHHQLHELLQRLQNATESHYGYAVANILGELLIQTRIHFAVEESLMRVLSYPDAEAHEAEHHRLSDQLEKLRQRSQDFQVSDRLTDFIQTWLIDHVNNFDREFVSHFLAKGIDPKAAPKPD
jgi:hemerythrin